MKRVIHNRSYGYIEEIDCYFLRHHRQPIIGNTEALGPHQLLDLFMQQKSIMG